MAAGVRMLPIVGKLLLKKKKIKNPSRGGGALPRACR